MTYSNVPLTGQTLGNTRNPINSNFSLIQTAFSLNHYSIGSAGGSNSGKHKIVSMPQQSASPDTASLEIATYCLRDPNNPNEPNLFLVAQNSSTSPGPIYKYQLTKTITSQFAGFNARPNGWTFLPGGIIMQYGQVTSPATTAQIIFPFAFPNGIPFNIQLTASTNNNTSVASVGIANVPSPPTDSSFYYFTNVGMNGVIYWSALGK